MEFRSWRRVVFVCAVSVILSGCGSVPSGFLSGNSQLKGTWTDNQQGLILMIDSVGNVTNDSFTWGTLVKCDGKMYNTTQTGVQVMVNPYTITVDNAGKITMANHTCKVTNNGTTTELTVSGTGTLDSSKAMTITAIVVQGANANTQQYTFTKTSD